MQLLTLESVDDAPRPTESGEPCDGAERQKLEQLWREGRLQKHLESLEAFYRAKRKDFLQRIQACREPGQLLSIARQLVVECGVVDPIAEAADQIREIESEIWIQCEHSKQERERIACEWASRYAVQWRQWRIKEYLFALERMQDRLPQVLELAP